MTRRLSHNIIGTPLLSLCKPPVSTWLQWIVSTVRMWAMSVDTCVLLRQYAVGMYFLYFCYCALFTESIVDSTLRDRGDVWRVLEIVLSRQHRMGVVFG